MLSAIILALTLKDDAMLVGERREMLFASKPEPEPEPEPEVCTQDFCGCTCDSTLDAGFSGCSSQVSV